MPKGYTNKTEIENYLLINIDESFSEQVDRWIEDIEKYIDKTTGRNFIADGEASERAYDGDGSKTLLIDDCVSVDSVAIDGEELEVGADKDFVLYPANTLPTRKIRLTGRVFPRSPLQGITVNAKWGYSEEVPADIRMAATILVAGIINFSNSSDGEIQSMSIGRYSVTYKDQKQMNDFERVPEILASYEKPSV